MSAAPSAGGAQAPTASGTVLLSGSEVRALVSIGDVIEAVEQAAIERVSGPVSAVPRVGLPGGGTLLMAAQSAERGGVAAKIVSIAPGNRAAGLATIQGLASWFDYTTRQPLLVADATAVTALRTGALSGVATRALAPPDAAVLTMVGVGGQALSQVAAVAAVRPIRQVQVVSLHRETAEQFRERLLDSLPDRSVVVFDDVATAVRDADIVCLATTAGSALIEDRDLNRDVHVNAVGAYRPDMKEIGVSVFAAACLVCADDPQGATHEAGDLMAAIAAGALDPASVVDLGALVGPGQVRPARSGGITVFKSVGSAAADLALLDLLLARAIAAPGIRRFDFAG